MRLRKSLRFAVAVIAVAVAAVAMSAAAGARPVIGLDGIGPRADHIAFMSMWDGEADIYTMDTAGFAQVNLTHDETVGERIDSEPAWSPDGQYVAFQRALTKSDSAATQLYVVRSDGSDLHALVPSSSTAAANMHPAWSPDGQTIIFSSNLTGHFELYTVKATGEGLARLTFTEDGIDNLEPAWSPDGTSIAFVRREWSTWGDFVSFPTESIYTISLTTATRTTSRITTPGPWQSDCQPAWSGDSDRIAFESNRAGTEDVYVVNRKGDGLTRVTSLKSNEYHPTWAPLGSQIALVSDQTGATEIYVLTVPDLGSIAPLPMQQLTFDKVQKANPAWERTWMMGPAS